MRFGRALTALAAALAVCGALGLAPPAAAQDDVQALRGQIERLRQQIADLERFVYRGGAPAPSGEAETAAEPSVDPQAARLEVRFAALEDELRALTGRVEEVAHGVDSLSQRLDKLVRDVDFRLSALERAAAEAPAEEPAVSVAPSEPAGAAPTAAVPPEAPAEPPESATPALPPGTPKQQYDYAFSLLRQHDYAAAERALEAFIDAHPDHDLTGNAYYWLAETYYVRKDYKNAAVYFARGYNTFPQGNKAPDNLLKLAMSLANQNETDKACLTFEELAKRFPDAPAAIRQRAETESRRAGCT